MLKPNKVLLVLLLGLAGMMAVTGCSQKSAADVPDVNTVVARQMEIEKRIELSGVLVPSQTVEIASKTSGQIIFLGFKVGDRVKKDAVLIQLDTEALNGQKLAAEANLQSARAAAESAANQSAISKINLDAAQLNYERTQQLFASGAVSQSAMDEARDKLDIASQQFATASGPARAQATAAVNSAFANLKNIEVQLGNTTIKSPIEGVITTQSINPGQVVTANSTLLTLIDTSSLKFKTTISQDSVIQLTPGQQLSIYVDSYPGRTFAGTVSSIGPIAVSTGEVFPVEITVRNEGGLMAGMSARSTLIIKAQGIAVPLGAVQQENGQNIVFVADDAQVNRRLIRTGFGNDTEVLVLEGLSEGEQVVTTSLNILADGMQVKIQ